LAKCWLIQAVFSRKCAKEEEEDSHQNFEQARFELYPLFGVWIVCRLSRQMSQSVPKMSHLLLLLPINKHKKALFLLVDKMLAKRHFTPPYGGD
jgi:hypothetical protein